MIQILICDLVTRVLNGVTELECVIRPEVNLFC